MWCQSLKFVVFSVDLERKNEKYKLDADWTYLVIKWDKKKKNSTFGIIIFIGRKVFHIADTLRLKIIVWTPFLKGEWHLPKYRRREIFWKFFSGRGGIDMKPSFSDQDCVFFCIFVLSIGEICSIYNAFPIFKAILVWYITVTQSKPCSIFQTRNARKPWGIVRNL